MKPQVLESERWFWADLVRASSILLVVLLHVSARVVYGFGKIPSGWWLVGHFFDSLSRASVPLFFMLSGSLLLLRNEKWKIFYKKRLYRILPAWIFWGGLFGLWKQYLGEFGQFEWYKFISRSYISGYWFMHILFIIYLLTPLFRKFLNFFTQPLIIIFWFAIIFFNNFEITNISSELLYIGYFLAGYAIFQSKLYKLKYLLIALIGLAITFFKTWVDSISAGKLVDSFYDYLSIGVCMQSIGIFGLMKNAGGETLKVYWARKIITELSEKSFGIFLSHFLILKVFDLLGIDALFFYPIVSIPLITITILLISYLLISLMMKNKYLKWLV